MDYSQLKHKLGWVDPTCDLCGRELKEISVSELKSLVPEWAELIKPDAERTGLYAWDAPEHPAIRGLYPHCCPDCAANLDTVAKAIQLYDTGRLETAVGYAAANIYHKHAGQEIPPFYVAFDISLPDIPVAQIMTRKNDSFKTVCEKTGPAALLLLRTLEGKADADR